VQVSKSQKQSYWKYSWERKAFRHSYSRHAEELGLPNFQQTKAAELQTAFNEKLTEIRNAGSQSFYKGKEFSKGKITYVNRTEPTINGTRYYYYETTDGKFIAAGVMHVFK
jgi:hypothetical protein